MLEDATMPALVMTSGNLSGHPIVFNNVSAIAQLGEIADYFILNDRDIHTRIDDSVVRVMAHRNHLSFPATFTRLCPYPVHLPFNVDPIIALGAELKTTVSIAKGNKVFMSQHIGDLKMTLRLNHTLRASITCKSSSILSQRLWPVTFIRRFAQRAMRWSNRSCGLFRYSIIMRIWLRVWPRTDSRGKTIGVVFDGTGYGTDGAIWGGEFLVGIPEALNVQHICATSLYRAVTARLKNPSGSLFRY